MDDDVQRNALDGLAGERVLLAQSVGIGERHFERDFRPQVVAVVDRGRKHRAWPVTNSPPSFDVIRSRCHAVKARDGELGCVS